MQASQYAKLATAHARQLAATGHTTEADYEYIRAYLFAHGWNEAEAIYGAALVRAAMIPTDLPTRREPPTMTATRYCATCGAPFTASPADYTVNCPAHRGRAAAQAAPAAPALATCYCGKTVTAGPGVAAGTTCPRDCGPA